MRCGAINCCINYLKWWICTFFLWGEVQAFENAVSDKQLDGKCDVKLEEGTSPGQPRQTALNSWIVNALWSHVIFQYKDTNNTGLCEWDWRAGTHGAWGQTATDYKRGLSSRVRGTLFYKTLFSYIFDPLLALITPHHFVSLHLSPFPVCPPVCMCMCACVQGLLCVDAHILLGERGEQLY